MVPKNSSGSWTNEVGCTALPEIWDRVVRGHQLSKTGNGSTSPYAAPLSVFCLTSPRSSKPGESRV